MNDDWLMTNDEAHHTHADARAGGQAEEEQFVSA